MLTSFFYHFLLTFFCLLLLPKALFQILYRGKYASSLKQRLGLDWPQLKKKGGPLIWVHAVSFGETRAVAPLVKRLKQELKDAAIIFSTITESGQQEAKKQLPEVDYHLFLPLDFSFLMKRLFKDVAPDLVLLTETDFWYHFLKVSKERGAKIAVVNGKISQTSTRRLSFLSGFAKKLFSLVDLFLVQGEIYQRRFLDLGVLPSQIQVTGNLKFDSSSEALSLEEKAAFKARLKMREGDLVLVIGSTHAPEEEELLAVLEPLWQLFPQLKIIIAPRHPQRFLSNSLSLKAYPHALFSHLEGDLGQSVGKSVGQSERLILIDTLGLLKKCYQIADVAIVAGSFSSKVGGHNIIEPCYYGVPVLFGPEMHAQPDLVRLVEEYGCGRQVSLPQLSSVMHDWLRDKKIRQEIGKKGLQLIEEAQGATERTLKHVLHLLKN